MTKQEIIEQLKNIKDQWANDTKMEIDADVIIDALTDIIHDCDGNDGMDFTEQYDTKGEINSDSIIEAITDIIHDVEGNDGGMDFSEEYDDEHYENFENVDFTKLEIG